MYLHIWNTLSVTLYYIYKYITCTRSISNYIRVLESPRSDIELTISHIFLAPVMNVFRIYECNETIYIYSQRLSEEFGTFDKVSKETGTFDSYHLNIAG